MEIEKKDLKDLKYAKSLLENDNFAIRATSIIGTPIEWSLSSLPSGADTLISKATNKALNISLKTAIASMSKTPTTSSWDKLHKLACATSGGAGGFFGISALAVELPFSTTIMLRSIADIARSEGELLTTSSAELECISVFAFGGSSKDDDEAESGYYTVRSALAEVVSNAAKYITQEGLNKESAPIIVKLISEIASRFGVQVTQKAIVQAIPLVGATTGAIINTIFIDHFQDKARGHFIIKRLERKYNIDIIKKYYQNI